MTVKKKQKRELCEVCNKRKYVMVYSDSWLSFSHGFSKKMCQKCYDEMIKKNDWYKQGYKDAEEKARELFKKGKYGKEFERKIKEETENKFVPYAYLCNVCCCILEQPCFKEGKCPECGSKSKTILFERRRKVDNER
jgi:hypothetical protein